MGLEPKLFPCSSTEISDRINSDLGSIFGYGLNHSNLEFQWFLDQMLIGKKVDDWLRIQRQNGNLKDQPLNNQRVAKIYRDTKVDRIDYKSNWSLGRITTPTDLSGILDAHLLRPGFESGNWGELRRLIGFLGLNKSDLKLVDDFYHDFMLVETHLENQT